MIEAARGLPCSSGGLSAPACACGSVVVEPSAGAGGGIVVGGGAAGGREEDALGLPTGGREGVATDTLDEEGELEAA